VERKVMGRLCQLLWCGRGPIICGIWDYGSEEGGIEDEKNRERHLRKVCRNREAKNWRSPCRIAWGIYRRGRRDCAEAIIPPEELFISIGIKKPQNEVPNKLWMAWTPFY
jgi:hypothetical protein